MNGVTQQLAPAEAAPAGAGSDEAAPYDPTAVLAPAVSVPAEAAHAAPSDADEESEDELEDVAGEMQNCSKAGSRLFLPGGD